MSTPPLPLFTCVVAVGVSTAALGCVSRMGASIAASAASIPFSATSATSAASAVGVPSTTSTISSITTIISSVAAAAVAATSVGSYSTMVSSYAVYSLDDVSILLSSASSIGSNVGSADLYIGRWVADGSVASVHCGIQYLGIT